MYFNVCTLLCSFRHGSLSGSQSGRSPKPLAPITSSAKPSELLSPVMSSRAGAGGINAGLTNDTIYSILETKVKVEYAALLKAFQTYDEQQSGSVTKGEFRRVLELYCLPMNTEQFNVILGKVCYW